jgi:hypothetical protein
MGRKAVLTDEEQESIRALHAGGKGAKAIARSVGVGLSMVKRLFRKWRRPPALPAPEPIAALPVEPEHEIRALPLPADHGTCPVCSGRAALLPGLGICQACLDREMQLYRSRPIGWGRCWRCADDRPIHLWTSVPGGLYAEGLCGQHKNAELFTLSRQEVEARRRPVVDSRGLYWDENWRGGSWRAG